MFHWNLPNSWRYFANGTEKHTRMHTHTHTHIPLKALTLCPHLRRWAITKKVPVFTMPHPSLLTLSIIILLFHYFNLCSFTVHVKFKRCRFRGFKSSTNEKWPCFHPFSIWILSKFWNFAKRKRINVNQTDTHLRTTKISYQERFAIIWKVVLIQSYQIVLAGLHAVWRRRISKRTAILFTLWE